MPDLGTFSPGLYCLFAVSVIVTLVWVKLKLLENCSESRFITGRMIFDISRPYADPFNYCFDNLRVRKSVFDTINAYSVIEEPNDICNGFVITKAS